MGIAKDDIQNPMDFFLDISCTLLIYIYKVLLLILLEC